MNSIAFLLVLAVSGQDAAKEVAPTANETSASAERVLELARRYEFIAEPEAETKLTLESKPLLTYSNPVRGDVYGDVFVWTHHGRPQVVAAIFDYRTNGWMDSELHLLSSSATIGHRDGVEFWRPEKAGVTLRPLDQAPVPADSTGKRLLQMRSLAREFSVERNHPEQQKDTLRMLPQPIFRYASKEEGILDGAMFVFVEGTDPEAYLMLEAAGRDKPQWQFALARMNIVEFTALHQGQVVWHVDPVDWDTVFDKQQPYAIVRENPRRGLKRSR